MCSPPVFNVTTATPGIANNGIQRRSPRRSRRLRLRLRRCHGNGIVQAGFSALLRSSPGCMESCRLLIALLPPIRRLALELLHRQIATKSLSYPSVNARIITELFCQRLLKRRMPALQMSEADHRVSIDTLNIGFASRHGFFIGALPLDASASTPAGELCSPWQPPRRLLAEGAPCKTIDSIGL